MPKGQKVNQHGGFTMSATMTTQGATIEQAQDQQTPTIAVLAYELEMDEFEFEVYESDPTGGQPSRY
jgi:hypothetical protein